MDATTTTKAGISLYEAGGFALLLLAVVLVLVGFGGWFLIGLIRDISTEIKSVRSQTVDLLAGVIKDNTASNTAVVHEIAKQTVVISQQSQVLRERLPSVPVHQILSTPIPGS
jgi:Tfp pilus assembly protein PilN